MFLARKANRGGEGRCIVLSPPNTFRLFLNKPFIVKTDYEVIVKFYNKTINKKLSSKRQQNFVNTITGNGY